MIFSCFECPLIGGDNNGGRAHAAGCGITDSKSYAGSGLGPVSVNQRGSASDREEVQARIPAACAFQSLSHQFIFPARTLRSYCVSVCWRPYRAECTGSRQRLRIQQRTQHRIKTTRYNCEVCRNHMRVKSYARRESYPSHKHGRLV